MKNVLLIMLMTTAIFIIAGCEQFSTSYQRIDDGEFRLLDFMFEPADASPGDTITVTAVFAGKSVDLDKYIDWHISYNVILDNIFGSAPTVLDSARIEKYRVSSPVPFSEKTQTVQFRIPIPKRIMRDSKQIPENWTDLLPPSVLDKMPAEFTAMSKNKVIDTLESFLEKPDGVLNGSSLSAESVDYLPRLLQIFSVPIRIAAKINSSDKPWRVIHSYQLIRYNRLLDSVGIKGIPINNNPTIDSIVVYKVKAKDISSFDSKKSGYDYTTTRLDGRKDTAEIVIEGGYSYFLEAFSSSLDSSITTMSGGRVEENRDAVWQFQLDGKEAGGIHHTDYMDVGRSMDGGLSKLAPPSNRNIKNFTLWVTVMDEVLGELNRPEASALAEVSGRFVYK